MHTRTQRVISQRKEHGQHVRTSASWQPWSHNHLGSSDWQGRVQWFDNTAAGGVGEGGRAIMAKTKMTRYECDSIGPLCLLKQRGQKHAQHLMRHGASSKWTTKNNKSQQSRQKVLHNYQLPPHPHPRFLKQRKSQMLSLLSRRKKTTNSSSCFPFQHLFDFQREMDALGARQNHPLLAGLVSALINIQLIPVSGFGKMKQKILWKVTKTECILDFSL